MNAIFELKQNNIDRILAQELARKLRLENRLTRESQRLINEIIRTSVNLYSSTGQLLNASEFLDEWNVLLRQHYRRSTSGFSSTLRRQINANSENFSELALSRINSTQLADAINNRIREFVANRPPISARQIVNTTQNDLDRSLTKAITDVLQEQPTAAVLSNAQVSRALGKNMRVTTGGRSTTIGQNETSIATEGAKNIESMSIDTLASDVVNVRKMWITVGDDRVRPQQGGNFNHVAADRQLVDEEDSFIVSNQRLMFPTDTSLGASLGNVINCRCLATRFALDISPPA